jgi:hypothetical protein
MSTTSAAQSRVDEIVPVLSSNPRREGAAVYGQHRPQNDLAHSCRYNRFMAVRIYVDAYSGYKAHERPQRFDLDGAVYEIATVLYRWYAPSATYYKVQTTDYKVLILRYDEQADEWTLQSGFDGDELLARSSIELVPVDADAIRQAEKLIDGCEHCHEEDADVPFDWILDRVTGRSGATTDYILTEPARCPTCKHEITEKTLVELLP